MTKQRITIVFVPGLLCDALVFDGLQEDQQENINYVVADLTTQNSITQMAKDVLNSVSGNLIVFGHSMGARVTFEMARMAPERVKGIIVMDTGIHPYKKGEEIRRNKLVKLGYEEGMTALAAQWLPVMLAPNRRDDNELLQRLVKMVENKTAKIHEQQIEALLNRPNAENYIGQITCPALVGVGRQDEWSPIENHKKIAAMLPNSKLFIVEDAGHFAPLERPQPTKIAIREWLQENFNQYLNNHN